MGGKISLTFDDGPDPVWTPRVLDTLKRSGARATFFVVAPLAERHSALLRHASEAGHEVCFHCTRHVRHDRMTASEILADAEMGARILRRLGFEVGDWRTPWGVVTADTRMAARSLGLRLVGWTADSEDWGGSAAGMMLDRFAPLVVPGGIVLMHDAVGSGARRENCRETVELVGPLVSLCRSRGLEPVPLGELPGELPERNPGPVSGV